MKIKVDKFEGPLDLLLTLIEKQKLDITEFSLAEIAEQYIDYINSMETKDPDDLADFLLVAAKLLYKKSKTLLPDKEFVDDDSDGLEQQLKIYKKYFLASKKIEEMFCSENYSLGRSTDRKGVKAEYKPGKSLNVKKIKAIFKEILYKIENTKRIPQKKLEKTISIQEKIKEIRKFLLSNKVLLFSDFIRKNEIICRQEIIVSFLGILELEKQRYVAISQNKIFDDIAVGLLPS